MNYTEKNFEEHICEHLMQSGYGSVLFSYYNKTLCQLPTELIAFVKETQPQTFEKLQLQYGDDTETKLQNRIFNEIAQRGIIDVFRKGIKDRGCHFEMVYFEPKSGLNPEHKELYLKNRFTVVRQVHYSTQNENSLDMVLFLNGLPIITMELKNQLTNQSIIDSEKQYRYDRNPNESLFQFKRCIVHFCVDNDRVSMTTRLMGDKTFFLPYNKDIENPINPKGHKTSYLWENILQPNSLLDILENFAHVAIEKDKIFDPSKGKVIDKPKEILVFPRYHQLDVIRQLRDTIRVEGVGQNYLIQHTTGSGKSYSIGWLSHLLSSLYRTNNDTNRIFDTIIVVTDRKVLDKQLQNTIKQLEQTTGVVNPVDANSTQLREYLEKGKSIIITTIQKFSVISEAINVLTSKSFAVIVDEVHSSQSGESAKNLKKSLSKGIDDFEEQDEISDIDEILNNKILEEIRSRGKQKHISFFGFSGTPKNKTLELFGRKNDKGEFVPFHIYTMKQSIQEKFTLDVLENYMTYDEWFKLNKKIEGDKTLPKKKVFRRLINYVDDQEFTIRRKVRLMLDHFVNNTSIKINGKARAMVVVRSRLHCVRYKMEFDKQIKENNLNFSCLVAFSGTIKDSDTEKEYTENSMNNLPQGVSIPDSFKDPKYRILIVSNKFQTGFDEPLIHTMYVDKTLRGLQCVQTLSRLNRTTGGKTDTFVMDFVNSKDDIYESFQPYYQKTYLKGETNPNKLYTIESEIKKFNLFTEQEITDFCLIFYDTTKNQELLQPILNRGVDNFKRIEDDIQKEQFKSHVQSYLRLYNYIAQIATFEDIDLEKLYVYLKFLNKKLPKQSQNQLEDITELVNLDSFRLEETFRGKITLQSEDGEFEPMTEGKPNTGEDNENDLLSLIIKKINETYGENLTEEDKVDLQNVRKRVQEHKELQKVIAGDNSESNKRHKFDEVLKDIILSYVNSRFDFYKKMEDPKVKNFIGDMLYDGFKKEVGKVG